MLGNLIVLIGTVVLELPWRLFGVSSPAHVRARARRQARRDADYMVREMAGELTPSELRRIDAEERYTQDKNTLEIAAALGEKSWRDSYGIERSTNVWR